MSQANSAPPILNTPPAAYDQAYMQQLVNTLRTTLSQSASNLSNTNNNATTGNTLAWMDAPGMNQQAVANQIATTVPAKNFIINGGMEVAQRGNTAIVSGGLTYGGCDRVMTYTGPFTTFSGTAGQNTGAGHVMSATGYAHYVFSISSTGASYLAFQTRLESRDAAALSGQTVTISANVFQNTGNPVQMGLNMYGCTVADSFPTASVQIGPSISGPILQNGVVTPVSFTYTIGATAADNGFEPQIWFYLANSVANSGSIQIANWKCEIGSTPTPFVPEPIWQAQQACNRYYQSGINYLVSGYASTSQAVYGDYSFQGLMRVTPTMNLGTFTNSNAGNATLNVIDAQHWRAYALITATGLGYSVYNWTANAEL